MPESDAELRELRRRAYGPDADIADDPAAQSRLAALELAARGPVAAGGPGAALSPAAAHTSGFGQVSPTAAESPVAGSSVGESSVGESSSVAAPSEGLPAKNAPLTRRDATARRPGWWRRRSAWVIAAAAIVLTVAVSWSAMALLAPRSDLALAPVSSSDGDRQRLMGQGILEMYGMDRTTLQQYDPYRELRVWSASAANGNHCILLESDVFGVYGVNCAPVGLNPTFDLYMYPGVPEEISGELPTGSVVRFVLDESGVSVWVAPAETDA